MRKSCNTDNTGKSYIISPLHAGDCINIVFLGRPLAQAMSWECPPLAPASFNQRTMSCDTTTYSQDGPVHLHDDPHHSQPHLSHPPGISSSSSEHDNHETGTWSSDFSNSEDECSQSGPLDGVILVSNE